MNILKNTEYKLMCSCGCNMDLTDYIGAQTKAKVIPKLKKQALEYGAIRWEGKYYFLQECINKIKYG